MISNNPRHSGQQSTRQPPARQQPAPQSVAQPAVQTGTPVNAYSNAIDPRKLFPLHFDYLMRDFFSTGETPEAWRVLDAMETRLDENGMEVEFTLIRQGTDLVWRRRVLMNAGRLVRIVTR